MSVYQLLTLALLLSIGKSYKGPFRKFFPDFHLPSYTKDVTGEPLFLSPLIKAGNISEARKLAEVNLVGQKRIKSYSGFLTVNEEACKSNLFFWFFPALYHSEKAPVVLWLQGGPGGSSMFGLFVEHGPFSVTSKLLLRQRRTAWSLTHNLIYIDSPVGTGFSFTELERCFATTELDVAEDLYNALIQFFKLFSNFKKNDFYITGESYAGKYVPALAHYIDEENGNIRNKDKIIQLKGFAIGDGLCDPESMTNYGDFLFGIGLIDEIDRAYFKQVQKILLKYIKAKQWIKAFQVFDDLLNGDLSAKTSYFKNATGFDFYYNYLLTTAPKEFSYYPKYLNQPQVRKALHVGNLTFNDGSKVEKHLMGDVMQSVKPLIESLIEKYRVMIYNGQMDIIIGWPLTESFITSMKWSGAKKYLNTRRSFWKVGTDLAGYVKEVGNFTQVLVRNAGHMIPYDQPKWAFDLINRFTSGKGFK